MADLSTAKKVANIVKEPIESLGLRLWDVRFQKEGASWYLRVFIDKDGGVDINDCTDVSRLIDPLLDEADPINVSYYLEVCSPGLERELVTKEHFDLFLGNEVKVKLIRPRDKQRDFDGILKAFDGGVTVEVDGEEIYFAKEEISSVKLADFDA